MEASNIIIEPVLTEKSNSLREGDIKTYVFKVHRKANKLMVLRAVKELFSVDPQSCRIINVRGKKKANVAISRESYKRGYGRTAAWKKAMVTLAEGQKIDAFEGA
jgi:large subunit ribosomal protein L23